MGFQDRAEGWTENNTKILETKYRETLIHYCKKEDHSRKNVTPSQPANVSNVLQFYVNYTSIKLK